MIRNDYREVFGHEYIVRTTQFGLRDDICGAIPGDTWIEIIEEKGNEGY